MSGFALDFLLPPYPSSPYLLVPHVMTCGIDSQPSTHGRRGSLFPSQEIAKDSFPNDNERTRHPPRLCSACGRTLETTSATQERSCLRTCDSPTFLICPQVYNWPMPSTAPDEAPPAATKSGFLMAWGPWKNSTWTEVIDAWESVGVGVIPCMDVFDRAGRSVLDDHIHCNPMTTRSHHPLQQACACSRSKPAGSLAVPQWHPKILCLCYQRDACRDCQHD